MSWAFEISTNWSNFKLFYHFGRRVHYIHLLQDGCTVISDQHFTLGVLDHLIHTSGTKACSNHVRNSYHIYNLFYPSLPECYSVWCLWSFQTCWRSNPVCYRLATASVHRSYNLNLDLKFSFIEAENQRQSSAPFRSQLTFLWHHPQLAIRYTLWFVHQCLRSTQTHYIWSTWRTTAFETLLYCLFLVLQRTQDNSIILQSLVSIPFSQGCWLIIPKANILPQCLGLSVS
jgi:hypothetical protein